MMIWLGTTSPSRLTRCAAETSNDLIDFAAELQTRGEEDEIKLTWDQTERVDLSPDVSFTETFPH